MEIGDYVRTKKRGFQYPQIAQIKNMSKDNGYKNQYFIELDHNLLPDYEYRIYKEDIAKSSPNIINLIEVGDYVNGWRVNRVEKDEDGTIITCGIITSFVSRNEKDPYLTQDYNEKDKMCKLKSIVTHEQFESMEYKL